MCFGSLQTFANHRLLAVDPGSRFLGLAVRTCQLSDARRFGLLERTLPRGKSSSASSSWTWTLQRLGANAQRQVFNSQAAALEAVLREQQIAGVVFGMPYLQDGSRSRESESVRRQVQRLQSEWQTNVLTPVSDLKTPKRILSRFLDFATSRRYARQLLVAQGRVS